MKLKFNGTNFSSAMYTKVAFVLLKCDHLKQEFPKNQIESSSLMIQIKTLLLEIQF